MSNQNSGYTVQPPAVVFAANAGTILANVKFYVSRDELHAYHENQLRYAAELINRVAESIEKSRKDKP